MIVGRLLADCHFDYIGHVPNRVWWELAYTFGHSVDSNYDTEARVRGLESIPATACSSAYSTIHSFSLLILLYSFYSLVLSMLGKIRERISKGKNINEWMNE